MQNYFEEIKTIYNKINHISKKLIISYGYDLNYNNPEYILTLNYTASILNKFKSYDLINEKDFNDKFFEFGGIVTYDQKKYIRRINLNLSKEELYWHTNKGFQFFFPAKNSYKNIWIDSREYDFDKKEVIIEYFDLEELTEYLILDLKPLFHPFKIDYYLSLNKFEIILSIYPYKEYRSI